MLYGTFTKHVPGLKFMSEIEEVQEYMKADMEAMKDQMTTMIKAMMSMRKMMEVNVVVSSLQVPPLR